MKKKVWLSGLLALTLFLSFSIGVFAAPKLTMWFNNKTQKTDVRLINNKPYVPLSDITTLFGGKVTYDKKTNTYKVTSKDFNPNPVTSKSYNVNVTKTSGPMKFTISKVTIEPKFKSKLGGTYAAVVLDVKVQNTSTDKVTWHPAQGTYALNTGEQIDGSEILFNSGEVGGDFLKGTIKTGKIVLKVTRTIDSVNTVTINISGPHNDDYDRIGEDLLFDVKFR
jgi:hypothetical protein